MAVSTTVINTVARRLRDTANIAYPRAVLIRFVDQVQRVLNAHTKSFTQAATPAVANFHSFSPVYNITTLVGSQCASLETIRESPGLPASIFGKHIRRVTWQALVHEDPRWFDRKGPALQAWATIGKDILVLYPILNRPIVLTDILISFVPAIPSTILDNGSNDIVLDDNYIPLLQDIVEVLGCLKGRRFSEASDPIARVQQHLEALGIFIETQELFGKN